MNIAPPAYRVGTLTYTKGTLAILFIWLLWGDFCYQIMQTVVPSIMPLKFQTLGVSNTTVGLIMGTIPGMITTVLNPIISFKSDRFRSRWGRRIPFIATTLPFLVLCLVGLGFCDRLAMGVRSALGGALGLSPSTLAVVVVGTLVTLFSFFNTFVNSVFWYLFNDVVPEQLLARFMSWFRVVSLAATSLYGLIIFKHADKYASEIMAGAGVLYFVGFGLMCLFVKEGQYPQPPDYVGGKSGPLAAIQTYGKECLGLRHYWYGFLVNMGLGAIYSSVMFNLYYMQASGLTLEMIGQLTAIGGVVGAIAIPIFGWLADRFHPIRMVIAGIVLQIVVATPAFSVWLFCEPSTQTSFHLWLAFTIGLGLLGIGMPIGPAVQLIDPPLFMRIFPRERYGQFCSANSIFRSIAGILSATLTGVYLDVLTRYFNARIAYCALPLLIMVAYLFMLFFMVKLYFSWKRYGGDDAYDAPLYQTPTPAVPLIFNQAENSSQPQRGKVLPSVAPEA